METPTTSEQIADLYRFFYAITGDATAAAILSFLCELKNSSVV